jgi:hypothetical protein
VFLPVPVNAIETDISQVSRSIDRAFYAATKGREAVIPEIREAARDEAIEAGAKESMVEVVHLEEIPLTYLPSNAVRFLVKAVGELD